MGVAATGSVPVGGGSDAISTGAPCAVVGGEVEAGFAVEGVSEGEAMSVGGPSKRTSEQRAKRRQ